jgi:hypothetical protein
MSFIEEQVPCFGVSILSRRKGDYDAIWTVSRLGDTFGGAVGRRVCVFSCRRISDSLVVDFCGDFFDRAFVYG